MQFRKDINGLRAIAVIAVVLFHFNNTLLPGGFVGVDVFFVISGFLMTKIIFSGIENGKFSILNFYLARANRIIPALAVVCLSMLIFGYFFLAPFDYKTLGEHVVTSISFISNITYWKESGYFDASSLEKWLLHTWSLSVEWQFYLLYPILLVNMRKFMHIETMKKSLILLLVVSFIVSLITTYNWPSSAYFLLPSRAWEMILGGVAYLYPLKLERSKKKFLELLGLTLIVVSCLFISSETPWPGYLSLLPVIGTFLVIQAKQKDSLITGNFIFQMLGRCSYSIYLWHWPLVVVIYYFSLSSHFIYLGVLLSLVLGFLSYKYVESIKFSVHFASKKDCLNSKPVLVALLTMILGGSAILISPYIRLVPPNYTSLVGNAVPSPYRKECHIKKYQHPSKSCEYLKGNVSWAVLGDSHATEIAYALAKKLNGTEQSLKHFTFSGCKPSYQRSDEFNRCSKWYNDSIHYIADQNEIRNVIFNHRFTKGLFGGNSHFYPELDKMIVTDETKRIMSSADEAIRLLASKKDKVYVVYPIPELPRNIHQLIGTESTPDLPINNLIGTSTAFYLKRNEYVINHFNSTQYPDNVYFLKPKDVLCNEINCFAVKEGVPLYFDDDHLSIMGAEKIVELIP